MGLLAALDAKEMLAVAGHHDAFWQKVSDEKTSQHWARDSGQALLAFARSRTALPEIGTGTRHKLELAALQIIAEFRPVIMQVRGPGGFFSVIGQLTFARPDQEPFSTLYFDHNGTVADSLTFNDGLRASVRDIEAGVVLSGVAETFLEKYVLIVVDVK